MDWLGIGVLVIGIAFLILVLILIKPLNKATEVLGGVKSTTDKLPSTIDTVTDQAVEVMSTANATIADVNMKVAELTPIFEILGDAGRASRNISATAVEATEALKNNTTEGKNVTDKEGLNGLYGSISLFYYLYEKRKAIKDTLNKTK